MVFSVDLHLIRCRYPRGRALDLLNRLNKYFEKRVTIPRIRRGEHQEKETLINEEGLLFARHLRDEKPTWHPRIVELSAQRLSEKGVLEIEKIPQEQQSLLTSPHHIKMVVQHAPRAVNVGMVQYLLSCQTQDLLTQYMSIYHNGFTIGIGNQ